MMGKFVPTVLMICGAACFIVTFVRGHLPGGIFIIGLIVYSTIGFYIIARSYFFGHQKGHIFHFLQIIVYACFGVISLLFSYHVIRFSVVLPTMFSIFVVLVAFFNQHYKQIHDDFRKGIKRDFFQS